MLKTPAFDISLWEKHVEEKLARREAVRIETLTETVEKLKSYFAHKHVGTVFLFGSLTREHGFAEFSDIDIGVSGLQSDYFRTLCELEELLGREVDLVEIEKLKSKRLHTGTGIQIR